MSTLGERHLDTIAVHTALEALYVAFRHDTPGAYVDTLAAVCRDLGESLPPTALVSPTDHQQAAIDHVLTLVDPTCAASALDADRRTRRVHAYVQETLVQEECALWQSREEHDYARAYDP